MIQAALHWLRQGVTPLPLLLRSKQPAIPWARLMRHKPPEALVRRWFEEPRNLGLLCGQASGGLVVLDFDRPLAYYRWARANPDLAVTYTVLTARGRHAYLYLDNPPPLTCAITGGECKASGYVVAPPSVHPSGWLYQSVNAEARVLRLGDLPMTGVDMPPEPPAAPLLSELQESSRPFGQSIIDEIKRALPITVYLSRLTRLYPSSPDGAWLMAHCPFHDDRRPSMWVNAWFNVCRCFKPACPASKRVMDIVNCYALRNDLSNDQAIHYLAAELGL